MVFDYVLIDLDGTLTESGEGITNAASYTLSKFGIKVNDKSELNKFLGPPFWDSIQDFYGFTKEEADEAVTYYREYYSDKGIFENKVYEGIEDLLKKLKEAGMTLVVATTKLETYAKRIIEHFDLDKYFDLVAGADLEGKRAKKDKLIKYTLESCGITDLSKVIMIGDRKYDIIGAKMNGITSMGVLYGYGSRQEFEEAGADFIVETVEDIGKFLIGN